MCELMAQAKTKTCTDSKIVECRYTKEDSFQQFLFFPGTTSWGIKSLGWKIYFLLGLIWTVRVGVAINIFFFLLENWYVGDKKNRINDKVLSLTMVSRRCLREIDSMELFCWQNIWQYLVLQRNQRKAKACSSCCSESWATLGGKLLAVLLAPSKDRVPYVPAHFCESASAASAHAICEQKCVGESCECRTQELSNEELMLLPRCTVIAVSISFNIYYTQNS